MGAYNPHKGANMNTITNTSLGQLQFKDRMSMLGIGMESINYKGSYYKPSRKEPEYLDMIGLDGMPTGDIYFRNLLHWFHGPHRAVVLVILDKWGRVLLQQRALDKEKFPGAFDISAAAHVKSGELSISAGKRELKEEMNIPVDRDIVLSNFLHIGSFWDYRQLVGGKSYSSTDPITFKNMAEKDKYDGFFKIISEQNYKNEQDLSIERGAELYRRLNEDKEIAKPFIENQMYDVYAIKSDTLDIEYQIEFTDGEVMRCLMADFATIKHIRDQGWFHPRLQWLYLLERAQSLLM